LHRSPGLSFNHGNDVIEGAIAHGQPVTVNLRRQDLEGDGQPRDHKLEWKTPEFAGGALCVGLNAGHVSAAPVDASGNPVGVYNFPCVSCGKSADEAQDAIGKVAAKFVAVAPQCTLSGPN
jgi:hypothetical protein